MRNIFTRIFSRLKQLILRILRKTETLPSDGGEDVERPDDDGAFVCYYGCPNSNRTQKLQLSKKLYR